MKPLLTSLALALLAHPSLADPKLDEHKAEPTIADSWTHFQKAISQADPEVIGGFVKFPLKSNLAETPGFEDLTTPEGFRKRFETLFPPKARELLKNTTLEELFTDPVTDSDGIETGRVSFQDGPDEDGLESSIVYSFQISSEKIVLVAVDMAG